MTAISEPTLLIDEKIVRRNIKTMVDKAEKHGLELKPHIKTHQSIIIGSWMREYGINSITVSSVKMAEYFAQSGWDDITIAFPCNCLQADRLNALAKIAKLSILISDMTAIAKLRDVLTEHFHVNIEIDTGAQRTGLKVTQRREIQHVADQIAQTENLHLEGFYSHPGHSYRCRGRQEIQAIHREVVEKMQHLKSSFSDFTVCIGDTPCCSVAQDFEGIDQISPGNFVFYDLMQYEIGSCRVKDIGVALACPVVALYPNRREIAMYGGAIHLSKESLGNNKNRHFGKVVSLNENLSREPKLEDAFVKSISQEHGIVQCSESYFKTIDVGDIIGILPVHSCLTADCMGKYFNVSSAKVIDHLEETKR